MILVTGGTGFVGRSLVAALVARGRAVRVLTRSPARAAALPAAVETVVGNVLDRPSLKGALDGVDAVVHLAASHVADGAGAERNAAVNATGTDNLVTEARTARVRRFILISSASVYGMRDGSFCHRETDVPEPSTTYGRSKLAAEGIVAAMGDRAGTRWVILRPTDIFGRGSGSWERLIDRVRRRRVWVHAGPPAFIHPVYIDDVVGCGIRALENDSLHRMVLNISGEASIPYPKLLETIAEACATKLVQVQIPTGLTRVPAVLTAWALRSAGRSPSFSLVRMGWRSDRRDIDSSKARELLGLSPTPLLQAMRITVGSINAPESEAGLRSAVR
ncbi:MAG TPA: NAD(P)-dependent oxidoreductase [Vicinamibacterales bacterium]|nr:NAD(P)-dependent oxidoreductase [Vicinamibacterales bacterium]